jgi:hypothetical protein
MRDRLAPSCVVVIDGEPRLPELALNLYITRVLAYRLLNI